MVGQTATVLEGGALPRLLLGRTPAFSTTFSTTPSTKSDSRDNVLIAEQ